jgi:hypothetical protein
MPRGERDPLHGELIELLGQRELPYGRGSHASWRGDDY